MKQISILSASVAYPNIKYRQKYLETDDDEPLRDNENVQCSVCMQLYENNQ